MTQTSPTMVIANVSERLTALEARVASLEAENARLQAEDARLQAENAELRRRLGLNSSTRHKPPRSDGYRTKRVQPALPNEQRASGGQAGHNGTTLRMGDKPDQVKVHLAERCAVGGCTIAADEAHEMISRRQVVAVPEPKLDVTDHRVGPIIWCGQPQCGRYPSDVRAPVHDGPGVRALVTKRSVEHKLPLEHMRTLVRDLYGYEVNSETVEQTREAGYALSEPLAAQIQAQLTQAAVVHCDETGVRAGGSVPWLHTASNDLSTYLFVQEQRGEQALRSASSMVPLFTGWAIHDDLRAYATFRQAHHGACNAHILRELHGVMEGGSAWGKAMHPCLLEMSQQALPLRGGSRGTHPATLSPGSEPGGVGRTAV